MTTATVSSVLRHGVLADRVPGPVPVRDSLLVIGGAALTGLAAQVSVPTPLSPVSLTLQALAVLLTGAALGAARGAAAMLLCLAAGTAGVPWFAGQGHGWGGPGVGCIVSFVLAAAFVGELARRGNDRGVLGTIGLMALGDAVIHVVGATWPALDLHVGADEAVAMGVTPFPVTDAFGIALAAGVLPLTRRRTGESDPDV
ncbi:biotin transporter BioY [Streptomyces sp. NPDC096105]|uniref:biotin transporter BioY n=1 Tax=Streptomyces sp. NPDC096105 TaxID=3366074 RepID=UPI0037FE70DD